VKTGIFYDTKHGCTEHCVQKLTDMLGGSVDVFNLKKNIQIDINPYNTIIIGGSIYAGRIQKRLQKFCKKNFQLLLTKRLGLFICCMYEGEKAREQMKENFLPELIEHAAVTGFFGGAFDFSKMNPLERLVVKKVADIDTSVDKISDESITSFADMISL